MSRSAVWALLLMSWLAPKFCPAAEPEKPARVAVAGRVVDEQSQGVGGVKITAHAYTEIIHATTDEQGRFTLDLPAQRTTLIVAEDPRADRLGIHTGAFKQSPEEPIRIALAKCRRVPVEVL